MLHDLAPAPPTDFDFIIGDWRVLHERLDSRLTGCTEWTRFEGLTTTRKILGGWGNVEDNVLHLPSGPYRAAAMRSFDKDTGQWAIWWLDGRAPHTLDVPVRGSFEHGVGHFYADDQLDGRPFRVRFTWLIGADGHPRWEQAFSPDAGVTWEANWRMQFLRIDA
ncbi:DUF1579 domain-containing protein [Roseateles sp. DC23W]|uniref:DUF1579 domain-containing protein n=1 Tax=Pelomonas dachongensis TaxID=3299029 RepID=A0ABW7EMU3_9BURK